MRPLRRILRPPELASFRMTAIDVPAIRGTSRFFVDEVLREIRREGVQRSTGSRVRRWPARWTFHAERSSDHHGGVIPHSSSPELSAYQMPARLTSARIAKLKPPIWGKVRERTSAKPHHVAAAPLPNLSRKAVERGRMMCLSHLSWITAFYDTVESTYTDVNATETGKHVRERRVRGHMMWLVHLLRFFTVLSCKYVVGLGLSGRTRKPPCSAQHLSGPRGARHDACADPRNARSRQQAPHDSSFRPKSKLAEVDGAR